MTELQLRVLREGTETNMRKGQQGLDHQTIHLELDFYTKKKAIQRF